MTGHAAGQTRVRGAGTGSGRSRAGRFALVGVVNTAIDFVGFGLLAAVGTPLLLANFASTTAGMTFGFFAHRAFSFRSTRHWRQTVLPFLLTSAVGLWVVQPLVIWLVRSVLLGPLDLSGALVAVWVPKACAIAVALVWNFALYHFVVFPAVDDEERR